jgi:hypothetical protein
MGELYSPPDILYFPTMANLAWDCPAVLLLANPNRKTSPHCRQHRKSIYKSTTPPPLKFIFHSALYSHSSRLLLGRLSFLGKN